LVDFVLFLPVCDAGNCERSSRRRSLTKRECIYLAVSVFCECNQNSSRQGPGGRTGGRAAFSQNKWKRIWRSPTAAAKSGNRRALNQAAVSAPRGVIYVRKDFSVLLEKNWTRRGRRHHSARLLSLT